jgi:pimeloyl-ACP methyl ester carboxylesterase
MQNLVTNDQSGYEWRVNLDAFKSNMTDILGFPEINGKQAYTAKSLFLGGHKPDYIAALYQSEICRLFPDSEIDFLDDAGHWTHVSPPKAVL